MISPNTPTLGSQGLFWRYWLARLLAVSATQMLMVALGWQMYAQTSSAWDLGLVGLIQFLPALLLTLPAGHIADRFNRAHILALSIAVQLLSALILGIATYEGWQSRSLILAISAVLGIVRAFQMPAQQALLPLLVPASILPRAVALSSGGMQSAIVIGPALGGALYVAQDSLVYFVGAVFSLLASVLIVSLRITQKRHFESLSMQSVLAGVVFVWKSPLILGAISLDLFAVLFGGATALLPIFARDILHTDAFGLGLLRAAPALGAVLMSVLLTYRPLHRKVGIWLMSAVALYGVATLIFGLSTNFNVSLVALLITGAADSVSVVVRQTLVQLQTPDQMRGRVGAVNSIFIGASNQLGEFESGASAALLGAVGSVVMGGIATLIVVGIWIKIFPDLAKRDTMQD